MLSSRFLRLRVSAPPTTFYRRLYNLISPLVCLAHFPPSPALCLHPIVVRYSPQVLRWSKQDGAIEVVSFRGEPQLGCHCGLGPSSPQHFCRWLPQSRRGWRCPCCCARHIPHHEERAIDEERLGEIGEEGRLRGSPMGRRCRCLCRS